MPEVTQSKPGSFCWFELATTDTGAAKKFYGGLFDWSANDVPIGEGGMYTILRLRGKDVGALYEMEKERRDQGIPPHWFSYVAVANADEAAKKAAALGGTVMAQAFDVMDLGRMAVLQDPAGAAFAVWQAKQHQGVGLVNEPGSHAWTELMTKDVKKAGDFYSGLFGWKRDERDMGGMKYTVFMNGGERAGGMMSISEQMGPVPPHWLVYFTVKNCDGTAERVKALGAKVMCPPTDIPGVGRFSVASDPVGAMFAVIQFSPPA